MVDVIIKIMSSSDYERADHLAPVNLKSGNHTGIKICRRFPHAILFADKQISKHSSGRRKTSKTFHLGKFSWFSRVGLWYTVRGIWERRGFWLCCGLVPVRSLADLYISCILRRESNWSMIHSLAGVEGHSAPRDKGPKLVILVYFSSQFAFQVNRLKMFTRR